MFGLNWKTFKQERSIGFCVTYFVIVKEKKLSYDTGVDELNPENTYWFVVKAVPLHGHDSESVCSGFKKSS